jgi:hypothetical protein
VPLNPPPDLGHFPKQSKATSKRIVARSQHQSILINPARIRAESQGDSIDLGPRSFPLLPKNRRKDYAVLY